MEKMIRFSKIGYTVAKVFKAMAWVGCGLFLVSLLVLVFSQNSSGLIYKGEGISVYAPVFMGKYTVEQAIVVTIITATQLVFLGFIMLEIQMIFYSMMEGRTPFTMNNVHYLRKVSLFMLLAMVIEWVEEAVLGGIFNFEYDFESFGDVLSVIVVYALSFVFEYGVKLQEEVDETL